MTRTQTAPLPQPLTAMSDVELCDRHQHEVAIVTDGQRAYVYPLDGANVMGDTIVARTGVTLTASCPVAMAPHCYGSAADFDPVQCDGQVTWRIDTEGTWGADADALRLLVAYGTGVEQ